MEARAWGVEHLSVAERAKKAIEAGMDQFGGESCVEVVIDLVRSGQVPESRIDESVRRLLRDKFRLGLFDDPYVDADAAEQLVGREDFRAAGELAQRRVDRAAEERRCAAGIGGAGAGQAKLYIENIAPEVAAAYGEVVERAADADLAILRLRAPYEPREGFLERMFHAGDLTFPEPELQRILGILAQAPTIVDIYLDRAAVIPEIAEGCAALLANFGASDAAVLDVIFGRFSPQGKLPFELPSSMEAVRQQKPDVPYDSEAPLFRFGDGLTL